MTTAAGTPLARLCLKARPTPAQLADRLRPIDGQWPDGLELYLDLPDIADRTAMDGVVERIEAYSLPADFALLIEGPLPSFDGRFFDITRDHPADRLVVERLAELADRLGARAVNIHAIAPSEDLRRLTLDCRQEMLERSLPFLRFFVERTAAAGAIPTVENIPPVARMRKGGWYFTPIGMCAADLRWLAEQVSGLLVLPDTSHAGLYLNARRLAEHGGQPTDVDASEPWLEPLLAYLRALPPDPDDLLGYFRSLQPYVVNAQVSNAAGLLGEGLAYAEGDFDLDPTIRWLGENAQHVVTETLEPDQDDARFMREALVRMREVVR